MEGGIASCPGEGPVTYEPIEERMMAEWAAANREGVQYAKHVRISGDR